MDRLITAMVYRYTNIYLAWSPKDAIASVSIFAGCIWIFGVFWIQNIFKENKSQVIILGLFFSQGLLQLFFGNIENYSLLAAGTLIYLAACIRSLRNNHFPFLPTLIFGVIFSIHLSAIWLGLGLFYLSLIKAFNVSLKKGAKLRKLAMIWLKMLGIFSIPVLSTFLLTHYIIDKTEKFSLAYIGGGDGKIFKPIFVKTHYYEKYYMFEVDHFIALLNQLLLIAPGALIIIFIYLIPTFKNQLSLTGKLDKEVMLVFLTGLGALLYIFTFNPDLSINGVGLLNEWDLLSLPAIPLTFLAFLLLNSEKNQLLKERSGLATIAISLFLSISWILHNSSP